MTNTEQTHQDELQSDQPLSGVSTQDQLPSMNYRQLFSGAALRNDEIERITRSEFTRIIVLAGAAFTGKTSLLATLNHRFQQGPFAKFAFAGSQTLPGFELRSHESRVGSGRDESDTGRTITELGDMHYLHIRLKDLESLHSRPFNLLFTDISGENYEQMKDSPENCRSVPILSRADRFVLFVDGKKISDVQDRQDARSNALMLLRSCLDSQMIGPKTWVDVVVSRYDYIENSEGFRAESLRFVNALRTALMDGFSDRVGRLSFKRIAVRPDVDGLQSSFDFEELFRSWVLETPFCTFANS